MFLLLLLASCGGSLPELDDAGDSSCGSYGHRCCPWTEDGTPDGDCDDGLVCKTFNPTSVCVLPCDGDPNGTGWQACDAAVAPQPDAVPPDAGEPCGLLEQPCCLDEVGSESCYLPYGCWNDGLCH